MKDLLKKEQIILETRSYIYIFLLILVFPLIVDKTGFFHILECKWYSYITICIMYLVVSTIVLLYFRIFKGTNYFKNTKLSIIQKLAIAFLIVNIVSCFASPFFKTHDLYKGVGRGEGLIAMTLYITSFLYITLFAKFKKRYILYFSISSILLNLIAISQYIGFNPFNMYQDGIGTHNVSFMTTIGNVDFISAMYCILLTVSFSAFIFLEDNKKREKIIHLLSVFMGFFIIGIINVQSGKVAFLATFTIILPFIIMTNKRLSRFLIVISTILMAYCINYVMNIKYHYNIQSLKFHFQIDYIVLLFIIVCGLLVLLAYILKKRNYDYTDKKNIIKFFYLGIGICVLLVLSVLYFVNFKSGILYEMHELLHGNFDDDFGTYRIFLWKRTLKLIPQYPILGSGPDSFAIRFMDKYSADIAAIGPLTINDTAANVYLTMIINLGIVGLFTYISFILLQLKNGIKNINNYSSVLLITFICYLIQDFFNLSLVIVTPIFWLLMALHFICVRDIKNKKILKNSVD